MYSVRVLCYTLGVTLLARAILRHHGVSDRKRLFTLRSVITLPTLIALAA